MSLFLPVHSLMKASDIDIAPCPCRPPGCSTMKRSRHATHADDDYHRKTRHSLRPGRVYTALLRVARHSYSRRKSRPAAF
jgi:hypothetical protein